MSVNSPHPHLNPVFVGRSKDIKEARDFFSKKKGEGGMLLIEGSRGSGKTRFLDELVDAIKEEEDVIVWRTGGKDVGRHPLHPLKAILPWRKMVSEVRKNSPAAMLPDYDQRYLVFNAISNRIKEMVQSKTTILALDDLHLCDSMTIYLIHYMLKYKVPLVIFTTVSSEDRVPKDALDVTLNLMSRERLYSYLMLDPIPDEKMGTMISNMLGQKPPDTIMDRIIEIAEGNPFLAVQLLQSLITGHNVVFKGSAWEFVSPEIDVVFPESVDALIENKMASLTEKEHHMLEICAVLGPVITFPVLLLILGLQEDDAIDTIESLIGKGLISSVEPEEGVWGDEEYTFTTHLLFKLAYESILGERRGDLHIRAAHAMDGYSQLDGVYRDDVVPLIAKHYFLGGEWGKALPLFLRAGKRAEAMAAYVDSRDLYNEAVIVMEGETGAPSDMLARTLLDTSRMALITGDLWTAEKCLAKAVKIAKSEGLNKMEIEGRIYAGEVEIERENYDKAEKICLETLQDAVMMGDMEHIGWCFERLGKVYWMKGEMKQAREFFQNGLSYTFATGDLQVLGKMNTDLGNVWLNSGEPKKALESYEKALDVFKKSPNKYEEARVYVRMGGSHLAMGDIRIARKMFTKADKMANAIGALSISARAKAGLAEARVEEKDAEQAMEELEKASNIADVVGGSPLYIQIKRLRGRIFHLQGELEDAEIVLKEAIMKAGRKGLTYEKAISQFYIGKLYISMGEPAHAKDALDSAKKIFHSMGNKTMQKNIQKVMDGLKI